MAERVERIAAEAARLAGVKKPNESEVWRAAFEGYLARRGWEETYAKAVAQAKDAKGEERAETRKAPKAVKEPKAPPAKKKKKKAAKKTTPSE